MVTTGMQPIDRFGIRPIPGKLPRSELLLNDEPTGLILDGVYLEQQFLVQGKFLLFLTEDCPFEEGLHIYLLSREMKVLDALEICIIYAPGILREIEATGASTLTFSFFDDECWRLEVLQHPRLALNSISRPAKHKKGICGRYWLQWELSWPDTSSPADAELKQ